MTDAIDVPAVATRARSRIIGLDLARAIAMLGMVIAHYAWPDGSDGLLNDVASAVDGRAMPLFVMLGGVGVTILTARSPHPDRSLLVRAAILAPMGLVLQELTTFIAIILHYYSVFFVAAVGLRRLPSRWLAGLAAATALIGSWTYQVLKPELTGYREPSDLIDEPLALAWSLLVEGFYPFFPVVSFFIIGMLLGRADLRSTTVAARLTAIGIGAAAIVLISADRLVSAFDVNVLSWSADDGRFIASRLLDDDGHSEMLAWVIGAGGSSAAVIGLSLLIAPQVSRWIGPLISLGQLALTFYVFQAVLVRFITRPDETALEDEFVNVALIYLGFMAFAALWRRRFRYGPLEWVLRLGSSNRQKAGLGRFVPQMVTRSPRRSAGK